jgi:hypothetical protein
MKIRNNCHCKGDAMKNILNQSKLIGAIIVIIFSSIFTQAAQTPGTWMNVLAPMSDEYVSTIVIDKAKPSDAWVFRENGQ